jgi:hypothetical protein
LAVAKPSPRWPLTIIAAILTFPLGLIALIFSSQVTTKWNTGDVAGAQKSSQLAMTWGIIFIVLGVLLLLYAMA